MIRIDGQTGKTFDDESPDAYYQRGMPLGLSDFNNRLATLAYKMTEVQLRDGGKLGRELTLSEQAEVFDR